MKIRTQDARQYLEYGELYADCYDGNGRAAIFIRNQFHPKPVCVGVYESMSRAKGVLYEADLAYQARQRVFYAPAE